MKDRLHKVIELKCRGSIRGFALSIGIPYDIIYNYYRKTRASENITADVIAKTILEYDDINPVWLLTGIGEMLLVKDAMHSQLLSKLESAREEIGYYKGILAANGINPETFRKKEEKSA